MPPLRAVDYRILAKVFEQDGFAFNPQRGDHLIYTKTGVKRPLVLPMYLEPRAGLRLGNRFSDAKHANSLWRRALARHVPHLRLAQGRL